MATAELLAPPAWVSVDFISDLHLQASDAPTFNAWQHFMQSTPADAVFILGDLFEVWVGDDALLPGSFEEKCVHVIAQTASRVPTFFMHGNRDFLVGQAALAACHTTLLADPTVLTFNGQRWLLSHGDALCLDDTAYMAFRRQVRSSSWQKTFLGKPLAERQFIARGLREQSEAAKKSAASCADVDEAAAVQWLLAARAATLIHGHTHKPREHTLQQLSSGVPTLTAPTLTAPTLPAFTLTAPTLPAFTLTAFTLPAFTPAKPPPAEPTFIKPLRRVVLSDWDAGANPPRAEVLRLTAAGAPGDGLSGGVLKRLALL